MNKKLGFYTIGTAKANGMINALCSTEFESKIQACIFANKILKSMETKIHPLSILHWNFNDEVFEAYDWTKEPEKNLDELYDARAKEIREKYDYVIISYSGGSDCHNVLMSFLRQNLHVDEIVVTHMDKAMGSYGKIDVSNKLAKYAHTSEHHSHVIPRLKELVNLSPRTKIRVFDVTDSVFEAFARHNSEDWIFHVREELNPMDASRYNYLQFPEFKKQLDLSKKVAIILGIDKPKIKICETTNKVFMYFTDRLVNVTPIGEYAKDYTNTTIEYFYWSPDACDLICKQAHTVLNYLKANPNFQKYFLKNPIPSFLGRTAGERIIRPLIYKTWDISWFQADKPKYDWHTEADFWFMENYKNTIEYGLWRKGISHVIKNCSFYVENMNFPDSLLKIQKEYMIGNLK